MEGEIYRLVLYHLYLLKSAENANRSGWSLMWVWVIVSGSFRIFKQRVLRPFIIKNRHGLQETDIVCLCSWTKEGTNVTTMAWGLGAHVGVTLVVGWEWQGWHYLPSACVEWRSANPGRYGQSTYLCQLPVISLSLLVINHWGGQFALRCPSCLLTKSSKLRENIFTHHCCRGIVDNKGRWELTNTLVTVHNSCTGKRRWQNCGSKKGQSRNGDQRRKSSQAGSAHVMACSCCHQLRNRSVTVAGSVNICWSEVLQVREMAAVSPVT